MLMCLPGVYRPEGDTRLLSTAVAEHVPAGSDALDVGTGSGALAVAAARAGARSVTAVDISRAAVLTTRLNAWWTRTPITVLRGGLECVSGRRFGAVIANPPYVPSHLAQVRGHARSWHAGPDGRSVLDPLCRNAANMLTPDGVLLLVQSALSGARLTIDALAETGLTAEVIARRRQPFGPVLLGHARWLERQGIIGVGQRHEELVVIRAQRSS